LDVSVERGAFQVDRRPADADAFRLAAIDPGRSVIVDACAGSGKTTLLVARIVRSLLEGAEPDQVLAVTFTRLAAHEMRERLAGELRWLALAEDAALHERLAGWYGLGPDRARVLAARARGLYEAVLSHPRGPEITTFHRWFRTLSLIGPFAGAVGDGGELTEDAAALLQQAWFVWLDGLRDPARGSLRADFEALVAAVGLAAVRRCLESLVEQRADWAVALDADPEGPADRLQEAAQLAARRYRDLWCKAAAAFVRVPDPAAPAPASGLDLLAAIMADDGPLRRELAAFAAVLAGGSDTSRQLSERLHELAGRSVADDAEALLWLQSVHRAALTDTGAVRQWRASKALTTALEAAGGSALWTDRWHAFAGRVATAHSLIDEWRGVGLNAAAMRCGADLLATFRAVKRGQGAMDFADLESIAWRLLRDPGTAAYLQCRMDRRYRHLLFDEFQDTSSLQWRLIADWLEAYAGAGERPSVFVVGDPRQSIYRFRRAEARVFDAARQLLREGFSAREVGTDTTWRNAPAIVEVLNRCLPAVMPHYRPQASAANACEGLFWRLPLVRAAGDASQAAASRFDWLASAREDEEPLRRREGLAIAEALLAARDALAAQGRPLRWGSVFVLARSRTGFAEYERALRERGLPVRSDRRGGLLDTLEGDDLRALLAFVRRPDDDAALAQVLVSPLVGLSPQALGWIAARSAAATDRESAEGATAAPTRWWPRLRTLAIAPRARDPAPFDAPALVAKLAAWIDTASRYPVHDFLDAVLAQVDAFARYPAAVEPAQRAVSRANLEAMLGLALDVDAGRFPSLARFLRRLRGFDTLAEREGPDEGRSDGLDAIRLMTIHGAKGLEADLVVLADAHQRPRGEGARLHVDWAPDKPRPTQVSFVFDATLAGPSRRESFERDAELREREDRNLLYVALTRARHGVIVSGAAGDRAPQTSWYTALDAAPPAPAIAVRHDGCTGPDDAPFTLALLDLPPLDVGAARAKGPADTPAGRLATELGHALHRALELLPAGADDAALGAALRAFALTDAQRDAALGRARAVLALGELAPAFAPDAPAAAEFEILDGDGRARRLDRIVRVGDETWILDYKWSVDGARLPEYRLQLAAYRALVAALEPRPFGGSGALRTVLVDARAGRCDWDVDLDAAPAAGPGGVD
jgi:ATP-dependent helicase/nuclease subunit A